MQICRSNTRTHTLELAVFLPLLKSYARPSLIIPAAGTWDFSFFPLKSNMNYLALCWSRWVSALSFPSPFPYCISLSLRAVYVVASLYSAIQNTCFSHRIAHISEVFFWNLALSDYFIMYNEQCVAFLLNGTVTALSNYFCTVWGESSQAHMRK